MQQVGYNHPMGHVADVLMGGGRCYFTPQNESDSCREDDLDLRAWARGEGWSVMENGDEFRQFSEGGLQLPFLGLLNDGIPVATHLILTHMH